MTCRARGRVSVRHSRNGSKSAQKIVTLSAALGQSLVGLEASPGEDGPEGWEEEAACDPYSRARLGPGQDRRGVWTNPG